MPTRFRTGVTYIEIMIAVFLVLFIGAILFPVFSCLLSAIDLARCQYSGQ